MCVCGGGLQGQTDIAEIPGNICSTALGSGSMDRRGNTGTKIQQPPKILSLRNTKSLEAFAVYCN